MPQGEGWAASPWFSFRQAGSGALSPHRNTKGRPEAALRAKRGVDQRLPIVPVPTFALPLGRPTLSVKMSSSWIRPFAGAYGSTFRVSDQIGWASAPLLIARPLY